MRFSRPSALTKRKSGILFDGQEHNDFEKAASHSSNRSFDCPSSMASIQAFPPPISELLGPPMPWLPWLLCLPSWRGSELSPVLPGDLPPNPPANPRAGLVHSPPTPDQSPPSISDLRPIPRFQASRSTNREAGPTLHPFALRFHRKVQRSFGSVSPTPSRTLLSCIARVAAAESLHAPPRDARVWPSHAGAGLPLAGPRRRSWTPAKDEPSTSRSHESLVHLLYFGSCDVARARTCRDQGGWMWRRGWKRMQPHGGSAKDAHRGILRHQHRRPSTSKVPGAGEKSHSDRRTRH